MKGSRSSFTESISCEILDTTDGGAKVPFSRIETTLVMSSTTLRKKLTNLQFKWLTQMNPTKSIMSVNLRTLIL